MYIFIVKHLFNYVKYFLNKSNGVLMKKNFIKGQIALNNLTVKEVHRRLVEKYGRTDTFQNFIIKVNRQTLKYDEIQQIANVLGYEIIWKEIDDK